LTIPSNVKKCKFSGVVNLNFDIRSQSPNIRNCFLFLHELRLIHKKPTSNNF
jgi:hypothetical protein